jgi:hypothetical protein
MKGDNAMNKIYYALVTRNGWNELHVSSVKKEVVSLQALSRKVPVNSKFIAPFMAEVAIEMTHYKAIDVTSEVKKDKSIFSERYVGPGEWKITST